METDYRDENADGDEYQPNSRIQLKDQVTEWKSVQTTFTKLVTKQPNIGKYGYRTLFRFATKYHKFLLTLGIISAVAAAICVPVLVTFFGVLTNKMVIIDLVQSEQKAYHQNITGLHCFKSGKNFSEIHDKNVYTNPNKAIRTAIHDFAVWHTVVGTIFIFLSCLYFICWYLPAEQMIMSMRREYFKALLRMDAKWFDSRKKKDFGNQLIEQTQQVREGIGQQLPIAVDLIFMFLFSCINAFYHGWALTLIAIISIPTFLLTNGLVTNLESARALGDEQSFSTCRALADEVISSIRIVMVYNAQKNELNRFKQELSLSSQGIFKRCILSAICNSVIWLLTYGNYALTFYFGTNWVLRDRRCSDIPTSGKYDAEDLIIVFFSIMFGAINVGLALPTWEAIKIAKGVGEEIFDVIDAVPEIDNMSQEGIVGTNKVKGKFTFKDVRFAYSSRPGHFVINGLNAEVEEKTTAVFVGSQGCGKSTILRLIMKEYLPDSGFVELDGIDTRDWNTRYLRSQIGVVSQAPKLFNMSIEENIRLGKLNATKKEIIQACKAADAHDFIMELKDGYKTVVGRRGERLNLGQRIRIAIAITLLKDPPILILDAPTAALDQISEAKVQSILNFISKSRTTFVVSHRLASIMNADIIFVLDEGQILEQGTYKELILKRGLFYTMVAKQEEELDTIVQEDGDTTDDHIDIESRRRASRASQVLGHTRNALKNKGRTYRYRKTFIQNDPLLFKDAPKSKKEQSNRRNKVQENEDLDLHHDESISNYSQSDEGSATTRFQMIIPDAGNSLESLDIDWINKMNIEKKELEHEQDRLKTLHKDTNKSKFLNGIKIASTTSPYLIILGLLGSLVVGAILPVYGIVFGDMIAKLSLTDMTASKNEVILLTWAFVGIGLGAATATFVQGLALSVASYKTVRKIRKLLFLSIIRQDYGWFEDPENSLASLTNRLSSDAANVEGIIISLYGTLIQCFTTIVASTVFAYIESVKLSLYCMTLTPLVISFTLADGLISKYHEDKKAVASDDLLSLVVEAFQNRETVTTLQLEDYFMDKFDTAVQYSKKQFWPLTIGRTITFGLAQGGSFCLYSLCIYFGGIVMDEQHLPYHKVLKVGDALIFGVFTIGSQLTVFPSFFHALESAKLVLKIMKRSPTIKYDVGGENILELMNGSIDFHDVQFSYPLEPDVKVLRGLSMSINPGKMYAIVGESGSGKTTIFKLMLRFYDTTNGVIEFFERDIKTLNCSSLRRAMALVSQEPRLFDRSIEENITFGRESHHVYMEDVIEAATMANIHDFIMTLPEGYKTRVGVGGNQLSAGQRQSIAIARALYTRSPILLLDDPTSSLDPESEKQFEETVEVARAEKTCVVIAQRVRSIRQADVIFVLERGVIVEKGTHEMLIRMDGVYAKIYKTQNKDRDI